MAKEHQSVAPKERVNITYKPATGDQKSEVELPLKMLFLGDYTGRTRMSDRSRSGSPSTSTRTTSSRSWPSTNWR